MISQLLMGCGSGRERFLYSVRRFGVARSPDPMRKKIIWHFVLMAAMGCTQGALGDEARCDSDHNELLVSIAHDRETEQAAIEQKIAATDDPVEQEHLRGVAEQAWDEEERLRGFAAHIWRDCIRAARGEQ